jgi:hypothetical protein
VLLSTVNMGCQPAVRLVNLNAMLHTYQEVVSKRPRAAEEAVDLYELLSSALRKRACQIRNLPKHRRTEQSQHDSRMLSENIMIAPPTLRISEAFKSAEMAWGYSKQNQAAVLKSTLSAQASAQPFKKPRSGTKLGYDSILETNDYNNSLLEQQQRTLVSLPGPASQASSPAGPSASPSVASPSAGQGNLLAGASSSAFVAPAANVHDFGARFGGFLSAPATAPAFSLPLNQSYFAASVTASHFLSSDSQQQDFQPANNQQGDFVGGRGGSSGAGHSSLRARSHGAANFPKKSTSHSGPRPALSNRAESYSRAREDPISKRGGHQQAMVGRRAGTGPLGLRRGAVQPPQSSRLKTVDMDDCFSQNELKEVVKSYDLLRTDQNFCLRFGDEGEERRYVASNVLRYGTTPYSERVRPNRDWMNITAKNAAYAVMSLVQAIQVDNAHVENGEPVMPKPSNTYAEWVRRVTDGNETLMNAMRLPWIEDYQSRLPVNQRNNAPSGDVEMANNEQGNDSNNQPQKEVIPDNNINHLTISVPTVQGEPSVTNNPIAPLAGNNIMAQDPAIVLAQPAGDLTDPVVNQVVDKMVSQISDFNISGDPDQNQQDIDMNENELLANDQENLASEERDKAAQLSALDQLRTQLTEIETLISGIKLMNQDDSSSTELAELEQKRVQILSLLEKENIQQIATDPNYNSIQARQRASSASMSIQPAEPPLVAIYADSNGKRLVKSKLGLDHKLFVHAVSGAKASYFFNVIGQSEGVIARRLVILILSTNDVNDDSELVIEDMTKIVQILRGKGFSGKILVCPVPQNQADSAIRDKFSRSNDLLQTLCSRLDGVEFLQEIKMVPNQNKLHFSPSHFTEAMGKIIRRELNSQSAGGERGQQRPFTPKIREDGPSKKPDAPGKRARRSTTKTVDIPVEFSEPSDI